MFCIETGCGILLHYPNYPKNLFFQFSRKIMFNFGKTFDLIIFIKYEMLYLIGLLFKLLTILFYERYRKYNVPSCSHCKNLQSSVQIPLG